MRQINFWRDTMAGRWETVTVDESAALLLAPGEEYDSGRQRSDGWSLVFGSVNATALVISATTRDELVELMRDAQREIDDSYAAEHQNALHTEYDGRCPMCQETGPTQRVGEDWEPDDGFFGPHSDAVDAALARDAERES